jgi:hypothetical protein
MAIITWIGGGNDKASNAKDWSPAHVPLPEGVDGADILGTGAGDTIKIAGTDLAGVPVDVGSATAASHVTIDLSKDAVLGLNGIVQGDFFPQTITINVDGTDTVGEGINAPEIETINLAGNGTLNLDFTSGTGSAIVVSGHGTVNADGGDNIDPGSAVTINAPVTGTGNFRLTGSLEVSGHATLALNDSVAAGISVNIGGPAGTIPSINPGTLLLNEPMKFLGSVDFGAGVGGGEIDLAGLGNADSYSYDGSLLTLFSGATAIDTLRLTDLTPNGFVVEPPTATGSVHIVPINGTPPVSLPLHG